MVDLIGGRGGEEKREVVSHFMDTTDQTNSLGKCENDASTLVIHFKWYF